VPRPKPVQPKDNSVSSSFASLPPAWSPDTSQIHAIILCMALTLPWVWLLSLVGSVVFSWHSIYNWLSQEGPSGSVNERVTQHWWRSREVNGLRMHKCMHKCMSSML
jgi:hypothetical protein